MKQDANASSSLGSETLGIREIVESDIVSVINLLLRGFPNPRSHWEAGFGRLQERPVPPTMPRFGYLLEANNKPVGVILLISSERGSRHGVFSNLSAWYVEPAFRSHATQLLRRALSNKHATYLSISPAIHVRPIYDALGFKCYSRGQFLVMPVLAGIRGKASIVKVDSLDEAELGEDEQRLLEVHAGYGCITFACRMDGRTLPFVFVPRIVKGLIPCAQLAYCREVSDLVDVAGAVGRYLLQLGRPFVLIDANGPIPGLPGRFFADVAPKYYKGAIAPGLGDLSETEATIFGFASPLRRLAQSLVQH